METKIEIINFKFCQVRIFTKLKTNDLVKGNFNILKVRRYTLNKVSFHIFNCLNMLNNLNMLKSYAQIFFPPVQIFQKPGAGSKLLF